MNTLSSSISPQEQYLIEWQCQQFLYQVAEFTDKHEWEALANCYTIDGVLRRPSQPDKPIKGRDAILASFLARPPLLSSHLLSNSIFEHKSANNVVVSSKVWLLTANASSSKSIQSDTSLKVGYFCDQLVKENDCWYIADRKGGIHMNADLSH